MPGYDDFVLLIMNCERYRHKAELQKKTWLAGATFPYYHVIGNEVNTNGSNDYTFDHEERILWVAAPDDYNSLPKKVMAAFAAVRKQFPKVKYIFKTDDSETLKPRNTNNFFQIIRGVMEVKSPKVHYAGNIVDVSQPYLSKSHLMHPELPEYLPILATRYCSGRFYVLSIEAVCSLILKREVIEREYFEDYAIGLHLNPLLKETMLKIDVDSFFSDAGEILPSHPQTNIYS
jgi:hypothetical protein